MSGGLLRETSPSILPSLPRDLQSTGQVSSPTLRPEFQVEITSLNTKEQLLVSMYSYPCFFRTSLSCVCTIGTISKYCVAEVFQEAAHTSCLTEQILAIAFQSAAGGVRTFSNSSDFP